MNLIQTKSALSTSSITFSLRKYWNQLLSLYKFLRRLDVACRNGISFRFNKNVCVIFHEFLKFKCKQFKKVVAKICYKNKFKIIKSRNAFQHPRVSKPRPKILFSRILYTTKKRRRFKTYYNQFELLLNFF